MCLALQASGLWLRYATVQKLIPSFPFPRKGRDRILPSGNLTLSYSIVANDLFGFPKLLTFLDQERNIIEEFPLQTTPFQNVTGKVCGAWNREEI